MSILVEKKRSKRGVDFSWLSAGDEIFYLIKSCPIFVKFLLKALLVCSLHIRKDNWTGVYTYWEKVIETRSGFLSTSSRRRHIFYLIKSCHIFVKLFSRRLSSYVQTIPYIKSSLNWDCLWLFMPVLYFAYVVKLAGLLHKFYPENPGIFSYLVPGFGTKKIREIPGFFVPVFPVIKP